MDSTVYFEEYCSWDRRWRFSTTMPVVLLLVKIWWILKVKSHLQEWIACAGGLLKSDSWNLWFHLKSSDLWSFIDTFWYSDIFASFRKKALRLSLIGMEFIQRYFVMNLKDGFFLQKTFHLLVIYFKSEAVNTFLKFKKFVIFYQCIKYYFDSSNEILHSTNVIDHYSVCTYLRNKCCRRWICFIKGIVFNFKSFCL